MSDKQYMFKCPECGSTEGVRINCTGRWWEEASRFDVNGVPVNEKVTSMDSEDADRYCKACSAILYWDDIENNLIPVEEGGSNE